MVLWQRRQNSIRFSSGSIVYSIRLRWKCCIDRRCAQRGDDNISAVPVILSRRRIPVRSTRQCSWRPLRVGHLCCVRALSPSAEFTLSEAEWSQDTLRRRLTSSVWARSNLPFARDVAW